MEYKRYKGYLAGVLCAVMMMGSMSVQAAVTVNNGTMGQVATNAVNGWPQMGDTYSETAVLMDADTGVVLYDKGKDDIRYPASTTKLMTLLLAVENCYLNEQVAFTETGVREVTPDSTNINMQVGEIMSMESCLYALIIQSANEVATQIAEYVGGSEEHFIEMMNEKAQELGCKNTNFVNANGLPDENHYSTAYDFALIMQEGLKNETFREIISTQTYIIPATNMSEKRRLHTHLPLLAEESPLKYEGCLGGKTGLTTVALNTLVVAAERDGNTYIAVAMRDAELAQNCADSIALLDYAFNNFERIKVGDGSAIVPKGTDPGTLTTKEENVDGRNRECYYFNDHLAGMGSVVVPTPAIDPEEVEEAGSADDEPLYQETEENDNKQEPAQEKKGISDLAKFLFMVMGVMVMILIVLFAALGVKKKKRKHHR